MTTIIGLAGSLRRESFNGRLLCAAAAAAPDGVDVQIESIRGIPLYDGDVEAEQGIPDAVQQLKDRIAGADGLLLVTPEYNASIPGVFKNAIDWLTRPPKDIARVFGGRPVTVLGATPGLGGTRFAQTALLPTLRALGTRAWFGSQLFVAGAGRLFDDDGNLTDDDTRQRLAKFMDGFGRFVQEERTRR
jgi:chromate reductase, NAD(P)H dehydrogenase (quinone)